MIEEAFWQRSITDARLYPLLADRLYQVHAPTDVAQPYAVYQVINRTELDTNAMGAGYTKTRIQVVFFAATYRAAKLLRDAFRNAWRGFRGYIGLDYVMACLFENEGDIPDTSSTGTEFPTMGVRIDLVFQHREDAPATTP